MPLGVYPIGKRFYVAQFIPQSECVENTYGGGDYRHYHRRDHYYLAE